MWRDPCYKLAMYKNLSASEYKKYLGLPEDYHVDGMLVYGTWNKAKQTAYLERMLASGDFDGARINSSSSPQSFLANVTEIVQGNKRFWYVVSYGGALLSEYLHLACLFGSKKNLLIGTCGGLAPDIESCSFIVPNFSYGNESTTRMYAKDVLDYKHQSDPTLLREIAAVIDPKYKVHTGPTMTCQAMMGETIEDIQTWSKDGYYGVEMEAATVFAVSNYFKVPAAALLFVGDNLIKEETVLSEGYDNNRALKEDVRKEQYRVALYELFK